MEARVLMGADSTIPRPSAAIARDRSLRRSTFPEDSKYPNVLLHIDGGWGRPLPVNACRAQSCECGGHRSVAHARRADLDRHLPPPNAGSMSGETPALLTLQSLRQAAVLLRDRSEDIARLMSWSREDSRRKARQEVERAAETSEWMAGEAQRIYGRTNSARARMSRQLVVKILLAS